MAPPLVLLESHAAERDTASFAFTGYLGALTAHRPEEVASVLEAVERAAAGGLHAAGFLAYEAAAGLDPAMRTRQGGLLPLAWFGLFRERKEVAPGRLEPRGSYALSSWRPSLSRTGYDRAIRRIHSHISAGDTYQVNFTFRMRAAFQGDDRAFYRDLCRSQRAAYCAYLDLGRFQILSASPELFFSLKDGWLTTRPMKGTRPRGRWPGEDEALAAELRTSEKERAENVMIVDMLRNDLGRVARTGSVSVPVLWEVERYETVLQMTSTVTARLRPGTGLAGLLAALFPCGSVTGAPKVRTMRIISELEDSPREIYTGSIGFVSPGPEACFNVAIRTVWIDRSTGRAEFGVGGGVTHDSSPEGEFEECRVKARVLTARRPEFDLLETLLFEPGRGYFLLERHLDRLRTSARYFGFRCDVDEVASALEAEAGRMSRGAHKVRVTLGRGGSLRVEHEEVPTPSGRPWKAAVADSPVDSRDVFLFHKTTHRAAYDSRRAACPGCDEVILRNERGEATECCTGNLVAILEGKRWTPPVECGLLAGTYRAELLERGEIGVRVLTPEDLRRAEALFLINSVRRWVSLELVE